MLWVTEDQANLRDQHELVETEGHGELEQVSLETWAGGHEEAVHYLHPHPALGGEAGHLPEAGDFVSIAGRGCLGCGLHRSGI